MRQGHRPGLATPQLRKFHLVARSSIECRKCVSSSSTLGATGAPLSPPFRSFGCFASTSNLAFFHREYFKFSGLELEFVYGLLPHKGMVVLNLLYSNYCNYSQ